MILVQKKKKKKARLALTHQPQLSKGYCCATKLINCLCMERLVSHITMTAFFPSHLQYLVDMYWRFYKMW